MGHTKNVLAIILFAVQISFAQSKISGRVLDHSNNPIFGANVLLTNSQKTKGVSTHSDGVFSIQVNEKGKYLMNISFVGYQNVTKTIQTLKGQDLDVGTIVLKESEEFLQTVEVLGRKRKDYNSDYSFSATKTAFKNKELPQSVASVTKEYIEDDQAFRLTEAVKRVSNVTVTGLYNHYNIRGITQADDGQILNGMRTRQYYFLQPITSHLERVEVIKGPSSVTFSSADPGGTVNMVTKKPLAEEYSQLSLSTGSFGTIRAAADFTGPLNENKTLLYRFNAAFQEANSFRDLVKNNTFLITPSISYLPNNKTALNVELIYSNGVGNLDRGQPIFGRINGEFDLNSTPISLNVGASNDFFKSKEVIIMTNFTRKITDNIGFNASYMKQTWEEDLAEHRTENRAAVNINGDAIPTLATMRYVEREQFWDTDNFSAFMNFDFKGKSTTNKLLIGYDGTRWERTIGGGQNTARRYLKIDGSVGNFDPTNAGDFQTIQMNGVIMPKPNVPHFDLENPSNNIRVTKDYTISEFGIPANLTTSNGIYVQNQFKIGKFSALINLRYEWFKDIFDYKGDEQEFTNEAFIPRIGLTYEISKNISAYATYLEGFQPQTNTVSLSPAAEGFFWSASPGRFDPLKSNLKEIGAKGEFFNGRAFFNFSIFDITQKNILLGDTYDLENLVARGEQRSRGFETDFSGYLAPNFQVMASYAFNDAEITEDDNPDLLGKRIGGAPKHSANFWGRYDFTNETLKGAGIGLGAQYSGDKYSWYGDRLLLPEYTVFDAAVYYKPALNENIQLTLKVNNVFNKKYWLGALNSSRLAPGAPRNILMNVTYKF
ncbi:iron complex outermembrane recepter protein [Tenacibaculum sp. MAR_2009_124]|uniref:TonB-dependent receptor n=1 Tax=Tenacibaculum sp. MAR_2009_124 TaxID=1250059 RepID=UPI00089AAB48|nr:TonB-dependent receptor [Tenacibaculum sp. MAR_2009_124]SEB51640.1 iron complex outermembrane recepter protein [Tenacibaculum sp. MAR_2009_124]